ncbi:flagellar export chaperone FliS [Paracidobacterium acidisoli]|uniref:Flagellar protein FliS n=1 Tax=Paracidobacterium acidisoli TaxID=2303751 RepID=A0A372IU86_9BACT|nr:flagellar export chaperone FliS [Paracidobacterium acidisoli]MBT9329959.1 flagellar protein FliS [Paracidobacterium acidisoli]
MENSSYQQKSVAGMNQVELVVALYDGMVRFLFRGVRAIEEGNVRERRIAMKRTLDILMHLQSRLRMEVGGPAQSLSEFYAVIFALCLEGSRLASAERLLEAIRCIRNVREAWQQVAQDPEVRRQFAQPPPPRPAVPVLVPVESGVEAAESSAWTA